MLNPLEIRELCDEIFKYLGLKDWQTLCLVCRLTRRGLIEYANPKELFELSLRKLNLEFALLLLKTYRNINAATDFKIRHPGIGSTKGSGTPITIACFFGNIDLVRFLLVDRKIIPNKELLDFACQKGFSEIVYLLLQDQRIDDVDLAMHFAVNAGHLNVVLRLAGDERIDPSAMRDTDIFNASLGGYLDISRHILKDDRVDPTFMNNRACNIAKEFGYDGVYKLLLQDERVCNYNSTKSIFYS